MQPPAPPPEVPPTGTTVALYSGGVDSYCMAVLLNPDVLLYVQMGGAYGAAEAANLHVPPGMETRISIVPFDLGSYELPDSKVIPGRNAILAVLASNYGDRIQMGSVDSSTGHDKDLIFAARLNDLFRWMYQPARWLTAGRNVQLELPVYHLTKTELVGQVLAAGHDGQLLAQRTFSCYNPVAEPVFDTAPAVGGDYVMLRSTRFVPCGKCPPCGRKWMAFSVYGIDVGFDGHEAIKHYWEEVTQGVGPQRSAQFGRDVVDAWKGRRRDLPVLGVWPGLAGV